jgi:hypothetical protein
LFKEIKSREEVPTAKETKISTSFKEVMQFVDISSPGENGIIVNRLFVTDLKGCS